MRRLLTITRLLRLTSVPLRWRRILSRPIRIVEIVGIAVRALPVRVVVVVGIAGHW